MMRELLTRSFILKCRSVGWDCGFVSLVDGRLNTRQDCMNMLRPSIYRQWDISVSFVTKHVHQKMRLPRTFLDITEMRKVTCNE